MSVRHVCSVLGLTSAIYLGVSAQHAELDGTNIVENLVLTYSRNARLEKGKRMKQAIPGQRCVHMPKIASQNALLRFRVERCSDVDGHQTGYDNSSQHVIDVIVAVTFPWHTCKCLYGDT